MPHYSRVELSPCQRRRGYICWVLQDPFGRPSPEGPAVISHPNPSAIHSRGRLRINLPDQIWWCSGSCLLEWVEPFVPSIRRGWTLTQVMFCCLHQALTRTNVDLLSTVSWGIHSMNNIHANQSLLNLHTHASSISHWEFRDTDAHAKMWLSKPH